VLGLLAHIAFTPAAARRLTEPAEQPGILLVGLYWRAEIRLQGPLSGRPVVDRGALRSQSSDVGHGHPASDEALAPLRLQLAAAETPAERRQIRHVIKAVRRNPYKAADLQWSAPRAETTAPETFR
jgi:hypothetical protein